MRRLLGCLPVSAALEPGHSWHLDTDFASILLALSPGMLVGIVLRIGPGEQVQQMLSFSNTIMLNVLLPPIILASGYDLRQESFFRNFGIILAFAFAGTFISAIVIGVLVYLWSLADFTISLTILECLIFGSTLSATDPVTILSIFSSRKVDPTLYSIIFGESLLNDAVSIVMFDTLSTFHGQHVGFYSIFHGIGIFLVVFTVSMALGVAFGLACSLMLKHSRLSSYTQLESCLVALIAYTSYFFSNAVTMSGIVSLLFCGITLKHYAYHNMSRRTQKATKYTFQTLASLSENFIFIYLGLSLFTQENLVFKPLFILVTVAIVVFSRYAAVFPIASLINLFRRIRTRRRQSRVGGGGVVRTGREEELSREYQIMLFWAGLRGAVGFALSAGIQGQNALALQTTVLVTIVLTLLGFGGTTGQMLDILGIRTGVQDDEDDSSDEEGAGEGEFSMRRNTASRPYANKRHLRSNSGRSQNGGLSSPRYSSGGYRDDETLLDTSKGFLAPNRGAGSGVARPSSRYSYDEDEEASESSDVLPSPGSGSGFHGGPPLDADVFPEAFRGSSRASGGARALLERGALIMRDGQWFQRIDDRYLKPYFSNAVASRKHEERKSQRAASRSFSATSNGSMVGAEQQGGSSEGGRRSASGSAGVTGSTGGNQDETAALWEAEAALREPDADVYSSGGASGGSRPSGSHEYDYDDDDGGSGVLTPGGGSRGGSGRRTPVGSGSRGPGLSSGVGGAFAM